MDYVRDAQDLADAVLKQLRLLWGDWIDDDGDAFAESEDVKALREQFKELRNDKKHADEEFETLLNTVLDEDE